jgi:cell division protein FtsL
LYYFDKTLKPSAKHYTLYSEKYIYITIYVVVVVVAGGSLKESGLERHM